ncbi:9789_t:CDS:2, partial [Entrophospora sp. SA101]
LDGKFGSKQSKIEVNSGVEIDLNLLKDVEVSNFQTFMNNDMEEIELHEGGWGDDEDSGWESDLDLEQEKKNKRGLYMKGKVPKSTFYDKWGPSGLFTKAAASASKITTYFPVHNNPSSEINENLELIESSSGSDDNILSNNSIDKKIKDLKVELDKGHNMIAGEYNKKRSIYEYLKSVEKNNGNKVKSSSEVAKLVYVDGGSWEGMSNS